MRDSAGIEVLITDGNRRPALAIARSLARRGVSIMVVADQPRSLAFSSRYVKHTAVSPSPTADPDAYFQFILETVRRLDIGLVIPVLEDSLLVLDRYRHELESYTKLATADSQALQSVMDKRINLRLAKKLGITCPRQFELDSVKDIPAMIDTLGFPIVLKPPGSPHDPRLPSFPFKVLYANDESELRDYLERYCAPGRFPLFQECATGEEHHLCCFAVEGEIVGMHEYHSIRRVNGEGVLREIVEPTSEAEEGARKMLKALSWNGVAQFSFFVDRKSNVYRYMETNGRFWSSVAGSVYAGWDFPYWTYRYFAFGEKPQPAPIPIGSQTCWHRGDLVALATYLAGGEFPAAGAEPGLFRAIGQYLSGFHPAIHSDVFSWRDPLPEFVDHWNLLSRGGDMFRHGSRKYATRLSTPRRRD